MSTLAEAVAELLGRITRLEGPALVAVSRLLGVAAALVLAIVAYRAAVRVIDRLLAPHEAGADAGARVQRARTLGPLMKSVARYSIAFLAAVVILREIGVDARGLLLSAGVLGLALGLGAQSLIKDVITGFFLLFEGLIGVGDVIEVGSRTGTVEAIGLRVTKLRLLNGAQWIVPNGELTQFANYHRGWARAVVDVNLGYETDVGRALKTMERVGQSWATETGLSLEAPEAQGVVRFGESDLGLRLMVKVPAAKRFDAELELRRRIKEAFEREGIPFPTRVVYLHERAAP
jgi:small conductance mechanosensitive channel